MKQISKSLAAALLSGIVMFSAPALTTAQAEKLVVTDVMVGKEILSVSIPSIEILDGNMSEADVRSLFKGGDLKSIVGSISGWSATSITIPQIKMSQKVKGADGADIGVELVYKNLVISDLKNGMAASSKIEGGELTTTGPQPVSGTFGSFSTGIFDFGGLFGLYVGGGSPSSPIKTIYKDVAFEGLTISGPKGMKCDFGKFAAAEFKARPMRKSMAELLTLTESMQGGEPKPADLQALLGFYSDIFTGIESAPSSFDGLTCKFADDQGRPVDFSIGKIEVDGFGKGRYPGVSMNNLNVSVPGDGYVKATKIAFKGMDLSGPFKAIEAAGDQLTPAWFQANYRKIIPFIDGFALEGVDVDVPDTNNPGARVKAKIGAFDMTLQNHQLGIPADIDVSASNVQSEFPADSTDSTVLQLREMGYTAFDIGFNLKAKWDEAANTIAIDELSATGVDMGTLTISGVLGNATKELFAEDPGTIQGAAMGLSVKELSISAENEGLVDKLVEQSAKQQGQEAGAFRTQISGMAGGMIPMLLGGTEEATKVAEALTAFINGGKSVSISAEAKDAAGLGLADLMAAQENPASLAAKVTFSAEHE